MKRNHLFLFLLSILALTGFVFVSRQEVYAEAVQNNLWQVQSIDTMKVSRDEARAQLNNPGFDSKIESELHEIKDLGANYVAVDTPYDDEFLPYLTRWVQLARKTGLRVWFRGNWSNWEGWFDYPKNMTSENHLAVTAKFVEAHSDLFEDGDIFDPCPECENAGYWTQPNGDGAYKSFLLRQQSVLDNSFSKIKKNVYTNVFSIIGGRAKEMMDQKTLNTLGNLVTIDHYVKDPSLMADYISFFNNNFHSKVLVGEFGAPVPDINGAMDENQQALFVGDVFKQLYKNKPGVFGVNYNVLTVGTTAILNADGTPRQVAEVIKNYYIPGTVNGIVTNTLGDKLEGIPVKTQDGLNSTITDKQGHYGLVIPASTVKVTIGGNKYGTVTQEIEVAQNSITEYNAVLRPQGFDFIYELRSIVQKVTIRLFQSFRSRP